MAETTSAPSLRELSEAATPGEWHVDMFPYFNMDTGEPQPPQCEGICTRDEAGGLADSIATCGEREATFIVALINAFRAGRLIDPTTLSEAVAAARAEGWQPIETAPRDRTRVLVAVPSQHAGQPMIVGEAYFDPDHEGGTWWWSGTGSKDYFTSSIHEVNAGPPTHWIPLPAPPTTPGGRTDG